MKKKTLFLAASVVLTAALILPTGLKSSRSQSAALFYPEGFYVYMENTAGGCDESQWLIEILAPVGFACCQGQSEHEDLPQAIGLCLGQEPQGNFNPYSNEGYIPEIAAIIICGLAGMGLAGPRRQVPK